MTLSVIRIPAVASVPLPISHEPILRTVSRTVHETARTSAPARRRPQDMTLTIPLGNWRVITTTMPRSTSRKICGAVHVVTIPHGMVPGTFPVPVRGTFRWTDLAADLRIAYTGWTLMIPGKMSTTWLRGNINVTISWGQTFYEMFLRPWDTLVLVRRTIQGSLRATVTPAALWRPRSRLFCAMSKVVTVDLSV